jgi:hypothetical protein
MRVKVKAGGEKKQYCLFFIVNRYDLLTGKLRAAVINTLSFGGQCRKVYSGDNNLLYRLPQSLITYNFEASKPQYTAICWLFVANPLNDISILNAKYMH